ncbi:MAG: 5'/3'-nucleotidase SurE [Planctomycetes bacterium]|nr:5'/3'-nucleotidase SurE [Planctomycetota bacterium]
MHILLSNDDGIDSPGLVGLQKAFSRFARVSVVAPRFQQSGIGHSISIYRPLLVHGRPGTNGHVHTSVDGTPADCVKLAMGDLLKDRPDLVVSGINLGANAGINVFYSGTVAGAVEGAFAGVPAMAISLATKEDADFRTAVRVAVHLVRRVLPPLFARGVVFNVNCPNLPWRELKGIRFTRQHCVPFIDGFERRKDPRGRTYYWIRGEMADHPEGSLSPEVTEVPTDEVMLRQGYVTVTPLRLDLTHYPLLASLPMQAVPCAGSGRARGRKAGTRGARTRKGD